MTRRKKDLWNGCRAYGGYDNVGNIVEEITHPLKRNVPLSVISALLMVKNIQNFFFFVIDGPAK